MCISSTTTRFASVLGIAVGLATALAFFFATMPGCSLVLDLEECTVDEDCGEFHECDETGLCRETERVYVSSHIVDDTTWTSDTTYVLTDMIMIIPPAELTIEPGTQIRGQPESGLVSRAGAKIIADGTRDEPIVFTSDQPVGQRLAGDWAGLALVGRAPTNRDGFRLRVDSAEHGKPEVGGNDETWNCGTLRYVRVEFGGSEVSVEVDGEMRREKALNGITLAGCGSETTVQYVQSHFSDDDGIVAFGGNVDIRNAVSTRAQNDGFGFDTGWYGTAQYLAVQQDIGGEEAIEVQNLFEDHDADNPMSNAQIYNFTVLGADPNADWQTALYFKRGGRGTLSHGIVQGQPTSGLYIEGAASAQAVEDGELVVQHTLFNDVGPDGDGYFELVDIEVIDDFDWQQVDLLNHGAYEGYEGFLDYQVFMAPEHNNLFGVDPGFQGDPYDYGDPGWIPSPEHTTGSDIPSPPDELGFDPTGVFRGAFRPGETPWTERWTAYPRH